MMIATERFVDLTDGNPSGWLPEHGTELVRDVIRRGDVAALSRVPGHFGLAALDGRTARLARRTHRPLRSFMAKLRDGPCLVVAERIDRLFEFCREQGIPGQFDPSYT